MRLNIIHESHTDFLRKARSRVLSHIMDGDSMVKKAIQAGECTIKDVIKSIRNNRCLGTQDRDLGATYLEQIVGGAIRDVAPGFKESNALRQLFGLKPLEKPKEGPREPTGPRPHSRFAESVEELSSDGEVWHSDDLFSELFDAYPDSAVKSWLNLYNKNYYALPIEIIDAEYGQDQFGDYHGNLIAAVGGKRHSLPFEPDDAVHEWFNRVVVPLCR